MRATGPVLSTLVLYGVPSSPVVSTLATLQNTVCKSQGKEPSEWTRKPEGLSGDHYVDHRLSPELPELAFLRNVFPKSPRSQVVTGIHGGPVLLGDEPGTPNNVLRTTNMESSESETAVQNGTDSSRLEHVECLCHDPTTEFVFTSTRPWYRGQKDRSRGASTNYSSP